MPASVTDKFRLASGSTRPVTTTLSLAKAAGATTAELTIATGWNTTTGVDVVIYRRQLNTTTGLYEKVEGTQTDWVATLSGTTLSNMVLSAGTEPASGYAADGNTVVLCAPTAQWGDDLVNGILEFANQDGTLKSEAVQDALGISGGASGGWDILNGAVAPTVATGYNKGNKEFDLTFAGVDLTSVLTAGMRMKLGRGTTAPTQCTDLEASSSQYASKSSPTGITFTDDFTCEAWVKLESYTGANQGIVSRYNGTNGFLFYVNSSGQLIIQGSATTSDSFTSYQSIPLNQWVHVAGTLDISGTTGTMYINGVSVLGTYTNGAMSAITQAGDLTVGSYNGTGGLFDGKIADVRVWSAVRTATEIRDNMNQQLVGNETNLVAYFKLNGNFNDSTANANNMTAQNSAAATSADNPMKDTEYAIITKVAFSTNTTVTVFTGTDHNIPNMVLTNPYYSTQDTPYGFPRAKEKWKVEMICKTTAQANPGTVDTVINPNGLQLSVPLGEWDLGFNASLFQSNSAAGIYAPYGGLSTAQSSFSDKDFIVDAINRVSGTSGCAFPSSRSKGVSLSAQTPYYLAVTTQAGGGTILVGWEGTRAATIIRAYSAHI